MPQWQPKLVKNKQAAAFKPQALKIVSFTSDPVLERETFSKLIEIPSTEFFSVPPLSAIQRYSSQRYIIPSMPTLTFQKGSLIS